MLCVSVCQHGSFQCDFHPCASMCTVYGDRHYRTFDGLLFDYIGDCKVYLLKVWDVDSLYIMKKISSCNDVLPTLFIYNSTCAMFVFHVFQSSADVTMSVTAENVDCFESGVICRKSLLISIGQSIIIFDDDSGKPVSFSPVFQTLHYLPICSSHISFYLWCCTYMMKFWKDKYILYCEIHLFITSFSYKLLLI